MFNYKNMVERIRKAYDPFKGERFKTFCGKLKDLPEDLKKLALKYHKLTESDFAHPDMEVKVIWFYQP